MVYKIVRSNELYHHGILGQRWGTRNGPPYPLDASDHSASEKKAGWKKSLAGGSSFRTRRLEKASAANKRDVEDLRAHGYSKEADAVSKVGDKINKKLAASKERDEKRRSELINNASDRKKYKESVKAAKNRYREKVDRDFAKYWETQKKIESKYSKGDTLSERDQERSNRNADKFNESQRNAFSRMYKEIYTAKADKKTGVIDREEQKFLDERSKVREKIANGTAGKIMTKLNGYDKMSKEEALKDFDEGTKAIKYGYERYKQVIRDNYNAKADAIKNATRPHNTAEYGKQVVSDMLHYREGTVLLYAAEYDKK